MSYRFARNENCLQEDTKSIPEVSNVLAIPTQSESMTDCRNNEL